MSSTKKLQLAATKFRKENSLLHSIYSDMIYVMSRFIRDSSNAEVVVKNKKGVFYAKANI